MAHALNRAPPEELLVKDHDGRVGSNVDAAADAKPREYPRPALKQTKKNMKTRFQTDEQAANIGGFIFRH
jgi:hypothetical protein